jgi:spermidine/putrescine transport system ATP-binding protein
VLLLDEPLGALDLKLRRQMQIELKRIQTEVGITFVHVTHDQEEAMTMADTVAVMNAGEIEQMGEPKELYEHPRTTFVANFLGQSNLIKAKVTGPDGDHIRAAAHGSRFSVPATRARVDRGPVFLGVRPEKLHLAGDPSAVPPGHQHVGGVVTDASYVGVSTQYLVRTAWGSELSVFAANSGVGDRLVVGTPVTAHWEPRHAFLLPRHSGEDDQTAPLLDEPPVGVAS